jgi:hypothetical protein
MNRLCDRRCQTYSCDQLDRNVRTDARQQKNRSIRDQDDARQETFAHSCVSFHHPVDLHWCPSFLNQLGILPMQTSFLVLLHPRNLLFQPGKVPSAVGTDCARDCENSIPLLCPCILINITGGGQSVRQLSLLFDNLTLLEVCIDDRWLSNDLGFPLPRHL